MNKKVLITGSNGALASELLCQLKKNGSLLIKALSRKDLDVTDEKSIVSITNKYRPDVIFHFAAMTDVDACEKNPELCYQINTQSVKYVALAAKTINATIVFPSTYYVYEGIRAIPIDDRTTKPNINLVKSVYSKSKLLAEEKIISLDYSKFFIVRLGSLFGGGKKDKKFVSKILSLASTQNNLKIISNQYVQPSYTKDSIINLLELLNTEIYGTYNMVGHGVASLYEYAAAILKFAHLHVKLKPISYEKFSQDAPRAKHLEAINGKLTDLGIDIMRDWKIALKEYIQSM